MLRVNYAFCQLALARGVNLMGVYPVLQIGNGVFILTRSQPPGVEPF